MTQWRSLCFVVAVAAATAACGSSVSGGSKAASGGAGKSGGASNARSTNKSDGGKPADAGGGAATDASMAPSGNPTTSVKIAAAEGGKVSLGDASLNIPAGSLGADITVTLTTSAPGSDLPDSSSVQGLIYDFGPDGTKFDKPATLTLPSAGKPGADQVAVISWLDVKQNAWQDLTTTVLADGSLSAEISHFTNYAVRFNGVISTDCGFTACGGDPVGTWSITGVCAELGAALIAQCPNVVAMLDLSLTGTATFNADGTQSSNITSKSTITYTLDAQCLGTITNGKPPSTCDALSKPADATMGKGPTTCTGDPSVSCTCVEDDPMGTEMKTGTYSISGNTLMTTNDADKSTTTAEFCVKGTEIRVKQMEGLAVLTWIAKKQ